LGLLVTRAEAKEAVIRIYHLRWARRIGSKCKPSVRDQTSRLQEKCISPTAQHTDLQ
jgi:hypothetical protein